MEIQNDKRWNENPFLSNFASFDEAVLWVNVSSWRKRLQPWNLSFHCLTYRTMVLEFFFPQETCCVEEKRQENSPYPANAKMPTFNWRRNGERQATDAKNGGKNYCHVVTFAVRVSRKLNLSNNSVCKNAVPQIQWIRSCTFLIMGSHRSYCNLKCP